MKDFTKLCTPARLYFAIAVIATIVSLFSGATMMHAFWQIFFAFIWTFILGWLCDNKYTSISWFLVLLPYLLILLAMLNIYHSEDPRRLMRAVKLQGAYGREAYATGRQYGVCAYLSRSECERKLGYDLDTGEPVDDYDDYHNLNPSYDYNNPNINYDYNINPSDPNNVASGTSTGQPLGQGTSTIQPLGHSK